MKVDEGEGRAYCEGGKEEGPPLHRGQMILGKRRLSIIYLLFSAFIIDLILHCIYNFIFIFRY